MPNSITKQHVFKWAGISRDGTSMQGQIEAPNKAAVQARLRRLGIRPKRIRKRITIFGMGGGPRRKRIRPADIASFARQTATMLASGIALVQALQIIAKGNENPAMTELTDDIRQRIERGATLAESLAQHPKYYDDLFVNLVAVGEMSGTLEQLLTQIAASREKSIVLKTKVRKALYYPCAIMVTAAIVVAILLTFVVPQFASLFHGYGADLPTLTQTFIDLSNLFRQWWWLVLIGLIATGLAVTRAYKASRRFRYTVDRCLLRAPIIGSILYQSIIAHFTRTLATMLAAGIPITEALESVGRATNNLVFVQGISQIRHQVETGQQLQVALRHTGLFPDMAQQLIAIGEESGSLDTMCLRIADAYEQEVDSRVDTLSSLIEPLVMAIIGLLVGGLVIAMYLPIFRLGSVI